MVANLHEALVNASDAFKIPLDSASQLLLLLGLEGNFSNPGAECIPNLKVELMKSKKLTASALQLALRHDLGKQKRDGGREDDSER